MSRIATDTNEALSRIEAACGPTPPRDPRDADTYAGEAASGGLSDDTAARVIAERGPTLAERFAEGRRRILAVKTWADEMQAAGIFEWHQAGDFRAYVARMLDWWKMDAREAGVEP
jgi:hypothetical protein